MAVVRIPGSLIKGLSLRHFINKKKSVIKYCHWIAENFSALDGTRFWTDLNSVAEIKGILSLPFSVISHLSHLHTIYRIEISLFVYLKLVKSNGAKKCLVCITGIFIQESSQLPKSWLLETKNNLGRRFSFSGCLCQDIYGRSKEKYFLCLHTYYIMVLLHRSIRSPLWRFSL